MSRQEEIERVMRDVQRGVDGVERVVVGTSDGLAVASTSPGPRSEKMAAMAASVVSLSQQTVADDREGATGQTVIRGSSGCLVVQGAGPDAVLAVRTDVAANMGLIQMEVPRAAAEIAALLA